MIQKYVRESFKQTEAAADSEIFKFYQQQVVKCKFYLGVKV